MGMKEWLATFRELHKRAKDGKLTTSEEQRYAEGRDDLARALLAAQRVMVPPDVLPRHHLRVSRAIQATLTVGSDTVKTSTLDLSVGGFSCLLGTRPAKSEGKVSLRVPGQDPLECKVTLVNSRTQPGTVRASFNFVDLTEPDAKRLETFVFDTVLSQLAE